jgi:hypothetical protein
MNFNIEHYKKYRKVAGKSVKDGIWEATHCGKVSRMSWSHTESFVLEEAKNLLWF